MEYFVDSFSKIVNYVAEMVIYTLDIIGILIILIGAIKSIYLVFLDLIKKKHHNVKISLANSLALGLEFKMGAEIIKTVIVRDLQELLILGIIILLRAVLAVMIHWEIKVERKDEAEAFIIESNNKSPKDENSSN